MFNVHDFYSKISEMNVKIRFDAGQPDLKVDEKIIGRTIDSLNDGETGYTKSIGTDELRTVIAELENTKKENVIVGNGSKLLLSAIISNHENIGIISPHWQTYENAANKFAEKVEIIKTSLEDRWEPYIEDLDVDLLIMNYPNNPTGKILSKDKLREIVDFCEDRGIKILVDEIYRYLAFDDFTPIKDLYDNVVTVRGFSKLYSMTGFRVGYALGDKDDIQNIKDFLEVTTTSVPIFIQRAGVKAIEMHEMILKKARSLYKKRVSRAVEKLNDDIFKYTVPEGGFYIFLNTGVNGIDFAYKLLERGVSIFPGTAFGDYNNFIRLSFVDENIEKGIEKINQTGEELIDD